jgi:hypothetical protein
MNIASADAGGTVPNVTYAECARTPSNEDALVSLMPHLLPTAAGFGGTV